MSTALSILAFAISCACFLAAFVAWFLSVYYFFALRPHGGFTTGTHEGKRIKRHMYGSIGAWVLLVLLGIAFGALFKVA